MVQDVVDSNLTELAADCISACLSVPIPKPHASGVRPLTVPETLYKLAGLVVLESVSHCIHDFFPSVQLGCGVRGGVEVALHRTQLALERGGPGTVTLRLDFRNALSRGVRTLLRDFSPLALLHVRVRPSRPPRRLLSRPPHP